MNEFGVLTNRKRALIALIHAIVFLGVALQGFLSPKLGIVQRPASADFALIGIYVIVASILAWLVSISRCAKERLYFVLCTTSATFGLLRTFLGDETIPIAQYMRVAMLSSAVAVGLLIVRRYARGAEESFPQ